MATVIFGSSRIGRPGGSRLTAESVNPSRPSSISDSTSAEVKVLLMLAIANAVSDVTGTRRATSGRPGAPSQGDAAGKKTRRGAAGHPGLARGATEAPLQRCPEPQPILD